MAALKNRVRNKLSLRDKFLVIRAFKEERDCTKLANIFQCSSRQIKFIISDKQKILAQHALLPAKQPSSKKDVQPLNDRAYELIQKVMFEWYYRAKCYPGFGPITYKMIRQKVQDARMALNIATFIPTDAWLVNFRNDCNKHRPDKNFGGTQTLKSLNMKVIAKFVLHLLGIIITPVETVSSGQEQYSNCKNVGTSMTDIIDSDSNEDKASEDFTNKGMLAMDDRKHCELIKTSKDALKYLKPIEEFVLLKENYRAIGLIIRLEAIFLKTSEA